MSSSTIPSSIFLSSQSFYCLRAFGCTCFVHNLRPILVKLCAKTTMSLLGIFENFRTGSIVVILMILIYIFAQQMLHFLAMFILFIYYLASLHLWSFDCYIFLVHMMHLILKYVHVPLKFRPAHPLYSTSCYAFVSSLFFVSVPKSTIEALLHCEWRQAMIDEMIALHTNAIETSFLYVRVRPQWVALDIYY